MEWGGGWSADHAAQNRAAAAAARAPAAAAAAAAPSITRDDAALEDEVLQASWFLQGLPRDQVRWWANQLRQHGPVGGFLVREPESQADAFVWPRHGYEHCRQHNPPQPTHQHSKGKGKGYTATTTFAPPTKGKGKAKGSKGKGKQKQGTGDQPRMDLSRWATAAPNGKQYCRNYQFGRCTGTCGRSHACPVLRTDGLPCNATHMARDCPLLS